MKIGENMGKPNKVELSRRVYETEKLLERGHCRQEILQYGSKKWGVCDRTIDDYIKLATISIAEKTEEDSQYQIGIAIRRYSGIYAKAFKDGTLQIALNAQKALCELLGLNKPAKIAPTTPDGSEPYTGLIVLPEKNGNKDNGGKKK